MDETIYDEQLEQLDPELRERLEAWLEEQARASAEPDDDANEAGLAELMEEPASGYLHGRSVGTGNAGREVANQQEHSGVGELHGPLHDVDMDRELRAWKPEDVKERKQPGRVLDVRLAAALEMTGGFGKDAWGRVVDPEHASGREGPHDRAGLRAHRGVPHPDEYVDRARLDATLGEELGVSLDVLRDVYGPRRGGPLPEALRELRASLDARLADVADLALLARLAGVGARTLQRAAVRGRAAR